MSLKGQPVILNLNDTVNHAAQAHGADLAFSCLDDDISFEDLAVASARLAGCLVSLGVDQGDRVGIFMRKSIKTPQAVFAVLHAGAVYVPIDPNASPERAYRLMEQCGIKVLICDLAMATKVKAVLGLGSQITHVIGLDLADCAITSLPWDQAVRFSKAVLKPVHESDPAYIIFTSGSTGQPKGIVHTHASAVAYARAMNRAFDVTSQDRIVMHAALHFDMSLFALFGAPLAGAAGVILPEAITRLPAEMTLIAQQSKISVWYGVPSALTQIIQAGALDHRDLSAMRHIISAGEVLPAKSVRTLAQALPHVRFSNAYGPAETNVCTVHHIDQPATLSDAPLPIGPVWDAASAKVLDPADQEVPRGSSGELVVRSTTNMTEYWAAPDLTTAAFYHDKDGTRFYRTGDIVVQDDKGAFQYLGRRDRQIKLKGYRIELDEIEACLSSHPHVAEAAVVLDQPNDKILAVVTLANPVDDAPETLVTFLQAHLPPYTLPAAIEIMQAMPRTATDKIDRRAVLTEFTK